MTSPWLRAAPVDADCRLVVFPAAGCGPSALRAWRATLPQAVALSPVNLPGREQRFGEPPVTDIDDVVHAVAAELARSEPRSVAVLGHSLGARFAFRLALALPTYGIDPRHLFAYAAPPPYDRARSPARDSSPSELASWLARVGGMPDDILTEPELFELLATTLLADLALVEQSHVEAGQKVHCPITAFVGTSDPIVATDRVQGWRQATTGHCSIVALDGGHFLKGAALAALLSRVGRDLTLCQKTVDPDTRDGP